MNDYDDSDDYTSANSFRARSNTWPLNRPDLATPNGVCIDETLPEIELEEDDLFTTNENWNTGLVDHDIMSWDPILNAHPNQQYQMQQIHPHQHQHQQQQHQQQQHHQQTQHQNQPLHHQQPPQLNDHQQQHHHQQQANTHDRQALSIHHHHQQIHNNGDQNQQHHHQHQQQPREASIILSSNNLQHQQPQHHHQTLNCSNYVDSDDPTEYHIQQMHQLSLENNHGPQEQQNHYIKSSLISSSPMYIHGSNTNVLANDSYITSSDPNNSENRHHLQPLVSAGYDLDQQSDLDIKPTNHHLPNTNHIDLQNHHHSLNHMTSSSLDQHSSSTHMLSSSLSTSGIGLSGDLEDLDYKGVDCPSHLQLLNHPSTNFDDLSIENHQHHAGHDLKQHQQTLNELHPQSSADSGNGSSNKSNSTTSSKTKLNTPRRNAWGNMSYADLISQAINSTTDKRLTLSQIYDWMVQNVPYFKDKGDSNSSAGWKNSVRHNLSLHNRFKRLQNEGTGKSSWWTINPEANIGKCARRRAASMEASKFEKKRGRAKKRAQAIRQGLISYASSSLNGSAGNLNQSQQQLDQAHQDQNTPKQQTQAQPLQNSKTTQQQPQQQPLPPPPPSSQQPPSTQQLKTLDDHLSSHQDLLFGEPNDSPGNHSPEHMIGLPKQQLTTLIGCHEQLQSELHHERPTSGLYVSELAACTLCKVNSCSLYNTNV